MANELTSQTRKRRQTASRLARRGFGLAETVVAIGLFSIIVSIAVGGFSRALRSQRQAAALLLANSNVSITIEQVAREMRTGYGFSPGGQIDKVSFTNAKGSKIYYRRAESGAIQRAAVCGSCLANESDYQNITADNVDVKYLGFVVDGHQSYALGDRRQPRITISIGVGAKDVDLSGNVIDLQTTISPRLPLDT